MDLRAPYISMSEQDDLPLLISDDLMWGAHSESINNMAKELKNSIANGNKHHHQQQQQQLESSSLSLSSITQSSSAPSQQNGNNASGAGKQVAIDSSLAALLCAGNSTVLPQSPQSSQTANQQSALLLKAATELKKVTQLDVDDVTDEDHIVSPIDVMGHAYKCKIWCKSSFSISLEQI